MQTPYNPKPLSDQKMDPPKYEPITSLGKLGDYEGSIFWMLWGVWESLEAQGPLHVIQELKFPSREPQIISITYNLCYIFKGPYYTHQSQAFRISQKKERCLLRAPDAQARAETRQILHLLGYVPEFRSS